MYVKFEVTKDRESSQILHLLEELRLRNFCSKKSSQNKTLNKLAIEFYINGSFSDDSFDTTMQGTSMSISKANIASIF